MSREASPAASRRSMFEVGCTGDVLDLLYLRFNASVRANNLVTDSTSPVGVRVLQFPDASVCPNPLVEQIADLERWSPRIARDLALAARCHDQRRPLPVARARRVAARPLPLPARSSRPRSIEERDLFAEAERIAARGAMDAVTGEPPSVPERLPMMTV